MNAFSRERVKGFLHADGQIMVNGDGEEVLLRGWGMGNWNNPEGFMLGGVSDFHIAPDGRVIHMGRLDRGRSMNLILRESAGTQYAEDFWKKWHRTYLCAEDIRILAEQGYNSVRLPLRACCFLDEEPGIHFNEDSFEMLTEILDACETYKIYAIIDLHAAVGAQSCLPCDDGYDNVAHLFIDEESMERTMLLCEEIARRYKDRWIVGGYDYINEPFSAKEPSEAQIEQLRDFYLELVQRVRKIDRNHMFLLNGVMFSGKVNVFDRNFDPECNNWGIAIHCYNARPELPTFANALAKRNELNVPVWMGETGGSDEWMASLFELLIQSHIGFNIWCWKSVQGANCAGVLRFCLPREWDLLRDYATKGTAKPSYAHAAAIWDDYLNCIKTENCTVNTESTKYILRRPGFSIPAVCYDALPANSYSQVEPAYSFTKYRAADRTDIRFAPGYEPDMMSGGFGRDAAFEHMELRLSGGGFVHYTVRDIDCVCRAHVLLRAETDCVAEISCGDTVLLRKAVPAGHDLREIISDPIPTGEQRRVRVAITQGAAALTRISFPTE